MRQHTFIAFAGAIALAVAGCSSEPETTASSPSPAPVASAPATKPATSFAQPLVAQKPPATGAAPGLIQSTNPNQRAQQVQASINSTGGNKNPFADLPPTIPPPTVRSRPARVPTVSQLPQGARPGGATAGRRTPIAPSSALPRTSPLPPGSSASASGGAAGGAGKTPTPSIAALPPLPVANLANAVQVTGVVRVGGTVQAIVQSPNEPTSRYVGVGQRLAGGQVLVKRIEMNEGSDPIVILEENGIEVARAVGEKVPQATDRPA